MARTKVNFECIECIELYMVFSVCGGRGSGLSIYHTSLSVLVAQLVERPPG